jgi:hypothetical protein
MSAAEAEEELRRRLTLALSEVSRAQDVLTSTLQSLNSGAVRAAKVAVSADVSDAFAGLRKAEEELSRIRELLEKV